MSKNTRIVRPPELLDALRLAFQNHSASDQRRRIAKSLVDSRRQTGLFDGLIGRFESDRLNGVIWSIERPGHTSITCLPQIAGSINSGQIRNSPRIESTVSELVQAAHRWQLQRQIALDQLLVEQEEADLWRDRLHEWGYGIEIGLTFMGRRIARSQDGDRPAPPSNQIDDRKLEFVPVADPDWKRLAAIISSTHIDTLDCPQIIGTQPMSDVLTGYQQTGESGARLWRIIRTSDEAIGCILCGLRPLEHVLEIVYLGVIPSARRKGVARAAVRWAIDQAQRESCVELIAAVDRNNLPALAIYQAESFVSWDHRVACVRLNDMANS